MTTLDCAAPTVTGAASHVFAVVQPGKPCVCGSLKLLNVQVDGDSPHAGLFVSPPGVFYTIDNGAGQ